MRGLKVKKLATIFLLINLPMVFGLAFAQDSPINGLSSKFTLMERQMAKDKLIDMGVNAVPLLIQGMKYSDENIKIECIRLLGEIKAKDAVPNLV